MTPEQWTEQNNQVIAAVEKHFGAGTRALTLSNASGFWNSANRLATEAKVACNVFSVPTMEPFFPKSAHAKMPYIMGAPLNENYGNIYIAENLIERAGLNLSSQPPAWMESLIAHEMGHMKQGPKVILGMRAMPVFAPIAAVAGYFLYEQFSRRFGSKAVDKMEPAERVEKFKAVADEEITKKESNEKKAEQGDIEAKITSTRHNDSLAMRAGKYLIVAALGVGTGALLTRSGLRHLEFDADAFAVKLTRDPQACEEGIRKLSKIIHDACVELPKSEKSPSWLSEMLINVFHAHPSLEERVANIWKTAKEIGIEKPAAHPVLPRTSHAAALVSERSLALSSGVMLPKN